MEIIVRKISTIVGLFLTGRRRNIRVFIVDWFSYNYKLSKTEQNRIEITPTPPLDLYLLDSVISCLEEILTYVLATM
ncbi:MAG: hypothetical protein N0E48_24625 [Candidatus Thiodiazotropha endolucinida]|nr:hypothetical protein [Candidatus Thiodiazotropha taylori]MCW4346513.1 hypothetical protein [Candidatus Thiodiazotropha endolucinida]